MTTNAPLSSETLSEARAWLGTHPVPPAPGRAWEEWELSAQALDPALTAALLEFLRSGSDSEQYGSLLALRARGADAWAEGYGNETRYEVTLPDDGETVVIIPIHASTSHAATEHLDTSVADLAWRVLREMDSSPSGGVADDLVTHLLEAKSIRAAKAAKKRWRDVYVATITAGSLLDGRIDILYEGKRGVGLIEVKRASLQAGRAMQVGELEAQMKRYATAVRQVLKRPIVDMTLILVSGSAVEERRVDYGDAMLGDENTGRTEYIVRLAS